MDVTDGMTRGAYAAGFLAGRAGVSPGSQGGGRPVGERRLLQTLADPNSDFYTQMRQTLVTKAKKHREEAQEEAVLEALSTVLDYMSGRLENSGMQKLREAGRKLEALTEDRAREMPWELQLLLRSVAGGAELAPEETEEQERLDREDGGAEPERQISGNGADDLLNSAFYGTIYGVGSVPKRDEIDGGIQPDLAAREALRWAGEKQI